MKTGDSQLVKRMNRSVLLRLMRLHPGVSRSQLSDLSGLTKSTVTMAVRDLIEEGWLEERALVEPELGRRQGRPSTPLVLSTRHHALAGIELAVDGLRLAVVSLTGEILWSNEQAFTAAQIAAKPQIALLQAANLLATARQQLRTFGLKLAGAGLGLPGSVDVSSGKLLVAPNLGWRNEPIDQLWLSALSQVGLSDVPTAVQNEADCAALGEYEFAPLGSTDALIFITCDVGVGAGIVLNDRIYAGMQGLAGEIGHTIILPGGSMCSCGRRGCAETMIGSHALLREYRATGDVAAAGQTLGVLLHNLWTTMNPALLVMGGKSMVQHPTLLAHAQTKLAEYAAGAGMTAPPVRLARYGLFASAVGAAALVLHHQLRPAHSDAPVGAKRVDSLLEEAIA